MDHNRPITITTLGGFCAAVDGHVMYANAKREDILRATILPVV